MLSGDAALDGRPDPQAEQPDSPLCRSEDREELARELERLPPPQRLVLTLYYNEGLRLK